MSKFLGGVLGHAIGDAMGVPLEFSIREKCMQNPVTKMIGYGAHDVPAGSWSDDTSMELAIMDSFINKNCFDYEDIMNNFYKYANEGAFTPEDKLFDIGRTILRAIADYKRGLASVTSSTRNTEMDNGNGTLMRIFPVVYYAYYFKLSDSEIIELVDKHSGMTHNHDISKMACYIYTKYLIDILDGKTKEDAYLNIQKNDYSYYNEDTIKKFDRILNNKIYEYDLAEISSTAFVVATLEAVLWVVHNTNNYKQSIIGAINLGNDTDTVGAITGSITGVLYGLDEIPKEWLNTLIKKDYIIELSTKFEMKLKEINYNESVE